MKLLAFKFQLANKSGCVVVSSIWYYGIKSFHQNLHFKHERWFNACTNELVNEREIKETNLISTFSLATILNEYEHERI